VAFCLIGVFGQEFGSISPSDAPVVNTEVSWEASAPSPKDTWAPSGPRQIPSHITKANSAALQAQARATMTELAAKFDAKSLDAAEYEAKYREAYQLLVDACAVAGNFNYPQELNVNMIPGLSQLPDGNGNMVTITKANANTFINRATAKKTELTAKFKAGGITSEDYENQFRTAHQELIEACAVQLNFNYKVLTVQDIPGLVEAFIKEGKVVAPPPVLSKVWSYSGNQMTYADASSNVEFSPAALAIIIVLNVALIVCIALFSYMYGVARVTRAEGV
jgi:hypothetical protein